MPPSLLRNRPVLEQAKSRELEEPAGDYDPEILVIFHQLFGGEKKKFKK